MRRYIGELQPTADLTNYRSYDEFKHEKLNLLLDTLAALLLLAFVWFVCEWWIRRRAARKAP